MIYKYKAPNVAVDIAILAGHGDSEKVGGYDSGAVGNGLHEHTVVEYVALEVIKRLDEKGYSIFYDEQNFKDNDLVDVDIKSKFALSIHANAANTQAKGVEALAPAKKSNLTFEFNIVNRIAELGTSNRGVKSRDYDSGVTHQRTNGKALSFTDYYGEVRNAKKLGIDLSIIELFFIDNAEDRAFYEKNKEAIINILVEEIVAYIKPSGSAVTPPTESKPDEVVPPSDSSDEVIEDRYAEKGQFIPDVAEGGIYVRTEPKYESKTTAMYYNGELCPAKGQYYHEVVITNKYVYIVYKRSNGTYGYLPVRERGGKLWGTIK